MSSQGKTSVTRVPVKPTWRQRILAAGAWSLLALTLAGSCGAWYWAFDLCAHFRWYYFVASLIWAIAIWKRYRSPAMCCLIISLFWNGGLLLPYYVPVKQSSHPDPEKSLSLISLNVYTANPNKADVVAYLRARQPDLIVVMEVDEPWERALDELKDDYPHRFIQPRHDNFGIGLLSKWPLQGERFVKFSDTDLPNIVATIDHRGSAFQLVATHPLPPIGAGYTRKRNAQLRELADFVKKSPLPSIVAGDFNATPWSSAFREFVSRSQLRDSGMGRGVQGSWNAKSRLIRIPIDHVFVPQNVTVVRRVLGPDIGSDHYPVEATIELP
ncbi:MAG: hypothetical protein JWM11_1027 [Planctomycetaceae bacterium]|nr:hypothetical protein [Planctomycetaceae bacterium]